MKTVPIMIIVLLIVAFDARSQSIDIEIDPIAYALKGFSLHSGLNTNKIRYNLGIFGLQVPEAYHGNNGFENSMWGGGAKLDYFFFGTDKGLYAGTGVDVTSARMKWVDSGKEVTRTQFGIGVNIGYKLNMGNNLFVKPWFGLGYLVNSDDVEVDGHTFTQDAIRPFPTVHIGWKF